MKISAFCVLLSVVCFSAGCGDSGSAGTSSPVTPPAAGATLYVDFEYGGAPSDMGNVYAVWIENSSRSFIQNIRVCSRLLDGTLTGIALPFWKINTYPSSASSEIDAVTSATKARTDFTVSAVLKDSSIRKFTLYFETDRSGDPNDWFTDTYTDQPALLYAADIDLDSGVTQYELSVKGWTPNDKTENIIVGTPRGVLQSDMRYISNLRNGNDFGAADARAATKMVKKITVRVE